MIGVLPADEAALLDAVPLLLPHAAARPPMALRPRPAAAPRSIKARRVKPLRLVPRAWDQNLYPPRFLPFVDGWPIVDQTIPVSTGLDRILRCQSPNSALRRATNSPKRLLKSSSIGGSTYWSSS